MNHYTSIVLSGGVFKASSMIGVIQYLEEQKLSKHLRTFVGTSAGAVLCFLLCMGMTSSDIKAFLFDIINDKEYNEFAIDDICTVFETFGIDSGERLFRIFKKALYMQTYRNDISFMDFAKLYGKHLVICVSNLTEEKSEFWSVDTHPNESVIYTLRMSCSVPMIFSPININEKMYVDGGLYNNFPISYFKDSLFKDIIGVNIRVRNYQNTDNFFSYIRFLIYSVIERSSYNENCIDLKNNIITLSFDDHEEITTFTDFKLNISESMILKYISIGYEEAKTCFANCTRLTEL